MCLHEDVTWYPVINEEGWACLDCGMKLGFRPDLDRSYTERKVSAVLQDFQFSKLIYVSNGTEGEIITLNVANRCFIENKYDQKNILRFILDDPNMNPESTFWQNRAERWLLGGEPIREDQEALPF